MEHRCVPPKRDWITALNGTFTHLAGYSLGAFLILKDQNMRAVFGNPLTLFAPFLDFKREAKIGGRIATSRLKLLHRQLRCRPLEALGNFYSAAGLGLLGNPARGESS